MGTAPALGARLSKTGPCSFLCEVSVRLVGAALPFCPAASDDGCEMKCRFLYGLPGPPCPAALTAVRTLIQSSVLLASAVAQGEGSPEGRPQGSNKSGHARSKVRPCVATCCKHAAAGSASTCRSEQEWCRNQ